MPRRTALVAAREVLARVGLEDRADAYPSQLSGGQQQRVAIARALVHEPRLLVCDEPTAALDAQAGQTVMELFSEVAVEPDRAVIIVTHDNRVLHYGQRIVHMTDGRIERVESNRQANTRRLPERRNKRSGKDEGTMKRYLLWLLPISAGRCCSWPRGTSIPSSNRSRRLAPPQTPARTPFAHSVAATGILEPASQNIAIGSALSGLVLEVYVPVERVGTTCQAGDPLFRVDDRQLKAQLALAQARAASARCAIDEAGKTATARGDAPQRGQGAGGQGQCRPDPR